VLAFRRMCSYHGVYGFVFVIEFMVATRISLDVETCVALCMLITIRKTYGTGVGVLRLSGTRPEPFQ
jgi:hypothetical protein